MIPAQRRRDILQVIGSQGSSSISDLSTRYGVSEMTIRRDLKTLEDEGHVKMTHGGAIYAPPAGSITPQAEPTYAAKKTAYTLQKERIAQYAAQHFVADNDIIALEAGTTVGAMVPFLVGKRNLTVVTNGLRTTNLLQAHLSDANIICTGGILRSLSSTFVGPTAEQFFHDNHIRKVFLSGIGFTLDAGLTDPQMIDTQVKKAMMVATEQIIVIIDSSKFGVKSFTQVIAAHAIPILVTDEQSPLSMLDELSEAGVKVHIAH